MTAEIINFADRCRPCRNDGPSETAINARKRKDRRDDWRKATWRAEFYRRLLEFVDAAGLAHKWGVDEAKIYVKQIERRETIIAAWRDAVAAQIQTPAPDLAAVARKRYLAAKMGWLPISADESAKAIGADEQWLKAHPVGQSKRARAGKAVQS